LGAYVAQAPDPGDDDPLAGPGLALEPKKGVSDLL
jgi:hypothetical protein